VNHDVLMSRLEKRIGDSRLLRVIRRYLEAGVLADGVVAERHEGTPQGGPLSPLLANVLLDEVDQALERSGHAFVRYADDCNVYVRSTRAGERVMEHLRGLYAKLRLRVNEDKSAVARAWDRKFLGYSFWVAPGREVKRRVAPKALDEFKERIRQITSRNGGRSLPKVVEELRAYLLGWKAYFRLADTPGVFRDLDQWIARRLRMVQLKQWKHPPTVFRELRRRGVPERIARAAAAWGRRWWGLSKHGALNTALPGKLFEQMGLVRLQPH
jgi:group II intron reverse transcriptase/maturase